MEIYKVKAFLRFARAEAISDARLAEAVSRANAGLIDADLGGGVIKQRVARPGQGKSGGYRTILLFRPPGSKEGERAIFAYGFAKNDRENLARDELIAFSKGSGAVSGFRSGGGRSNAENRRMERIGHER